MVFGSTIDGPLRFARQPIDPEQEREKHGEEEYRKTDRVWSETRLNRGAHRIGESPRGIEQQDWGASRATVARLGGKSRDFSFALVQREGTPCSLLICSFREELPQTRDELRLLSNHIA